MNTTLWAIGCLAAAYVIGGVILCADLRSGALWTLRAPEPILHFAATIYLPVFVALGTIWPDLFPFLP
jgi:hypothetical protein